MNIIDEEIRLTQEANKAKRKLRELRAACETAYSSYFNELQFRKDRGQQVSPEIIQAIQILREALKISKP